MAYYNKRARRMTTSTQTSLTLEQFLALPERASDGSHYELSEGELIALSPAGYRHGLIVINIAHVLRSTLDRTKFLVVGGKTGFLLDPTNNSATARGADVAITRRDDLHGSIPYWVVSRSSSARSRSCLPHQYGGRHGSQDSAVPSRWFPGGLGCVSRYSVRLPLPSQRAQSAPF